MRTFLGSGNLACSRVKEASGVKLPIHKEEEVVATFFKGLLLKGCHMEQNSNRDGLRKCYFQIFLTGTPFKLGGELVFNCLIIGLDCLHFQ